MEAVREELDGVAADFEGMLHQASGAIGDLIKDFQQQASLKEQVLGFVNAVDWTVRARGARRRRRRRPRALG